MITWAVASKVAGEAIGSVRRGLKLVPPPIWYALAAVLAVGAFGHFRYKAGVEDEKKRQAGARAILEARISTLKGRLTNSATKVVTRTVTKIVEVEGKTKILKEKVPYYVPIDAPDLPAGFRLLHDAAAIGRDDPSPADVAHAEPVEAQAVATTVIENYGACHKNEALLVGWQEWWSGVEQACSDSKACQVAPPDTGSGD